MSDAIPDYIKPLVYKETLKKKSVTIKRVDGITLNLMKSWYIMIVMNWNRMYFILSNGVDQLMWINNEGYEEEEDISIILMEWYL